MNNIRHPLPTSMATDKRRDSQEYWEERLTRMKLSIEAGRHDWLSFGHEHNDLDKQLDQQTVQTYLSNGENEWPISL